MLPRILRLPEVEQVTGLSTATIYRQIADGDFPKQVPIGANSSGWLETEIAAWQSKRIALRDTDAKKRSKVARQRREQRLAA